MSDAISTAPNKQERGEAFVVGASSLGTMFEWYDFFLYGALASQIAAHFFSGVDDTTAFIFALAAFAAGFLVRPFGALVFGRIGDVVGRKNTFLATMAIMGFATFFVGLLPTYADIGVAAPILLVGLRLLQGLAIGGEYGGAAIYVAEHASADKRGFMTSWINSTATIGLLLSLVVIMGTRTAMPAEAFQAWGWRVPFLVSILLLGVSLWIRLQLEESPVFQRMKAEAATSKAPLAEAFGRWENVKRVLIAMGAIAGSTTIWYAGQFYSLFFLERMLKVDGFSANTLLAIALVLTAPAYLFFGWLSDKIGRKPVMLAGYAIATLTIFPAFYALTWAANPALAEAQAKSPVVVHADPADCSFQFDLLGRNRFDKQSCDIARASLARAGISYSSAPLAPGAPAAVRVGAREIAVPNVLGTDAAQRSKAIASFQDELRTVLADVGYPSAADPAAMNKPLVVAIIVFLVLLGAMTYAPIAAMLVELFPARIRYTSLSLPYHVCAGWIGGLLPTTAFAIVATTGDIYSGLWYPVFFASISLAVGLTVLPETYKRSIAH